MKPPAKKIKKHKCRVEFGQPVFYNMAAMPGKGLKTFVNCSICKKRIYVKTGEV